MSDSASRQRAVFVSGASSGLGQAIAQLGLERGYSVWGTARARGRLERLAENDHFHPMVMDLNDRSQMLNAFCAAEDESGGFDVVVNNAGFGVFGDLCAISEEDWDEQITAMLANLMALIRDQTRALLRRDESATLVNVSSLAVEFPLPYMSGYNVAKAGLSALSESLLLELKETNIRVIDFRPGDFRTQFNAGMIPPPSESQGGDAHCADRLAAWKTLEKNLQAAPKAVAAAEALWHAVDRGRQGTIRTGDWFQARVAPVLNRLVPQGIARAVRWRYFGLR
ncbi:MAG: SDR family NAD(P)-dependent oxidoreductase [Opitutaceae bacterium]|jgi:uncharacterized protein|nr:SDR family NAD(P)-dependent oxidoreductase [Opitutaceae bacterium]